MRGLLVYLIELSIVVVSLALAREIAARTDIIPRSILPTNNTPLSSREFLVVSAIYLAFSALIFLVYRLIQKGGVFSQARRTVVELYALALANLFPTVAIFLFTSINFSAHFHLAAAVIMALLFIVGFAASPVLGGTAAQESGPGRTAAFFRALYGYSRSWGALAVLLIALAPVGLAVEYKRNDALKDFVIRTKIGFISGPSTDWHLENALPGISFRQPIDIKFSPAAPDDLYVLERHGRLIKITEDASGFDKEILFDFAEEVGPVQGENGAQGFALHPGFGADNQYVYVYYTHVTPGAQQNRLSRFDLSLADPAARLANEFVMIELGRSTNGSHNGGSMHFGPDGFLYFAIGDGAEEIHRQTIERSLFSGIFRIDVDRQGADISHPIVRQPVNGVTQGYFIPNDNPFVGQDAIEEFWALGLRNPFRFSFDPATGAMWTGDVGQEAFEEVNIVVPGGNYGWRFLEGFENTAGVEPPDPIVGELIAPHFVYAHTAADRAIIGGVVYRGDTFPELVGYYIYGDNFSGRMRTIPADGDPVVTELVQIDQVNQSGITSMTETPTGEVYVTTLGRFDRATGLVSRLARGPAEDNRIQDGERGQEIAEVTDVTLEAATQLYAITCVQCHGAEGAGDGETLEGTEDLPPDFRTAAWQASRTDGEILAIMRDGGEANGLSNAMPPWQGALTDAELERMVEVLRAFAN